MYNRTSVSRSICVVCLTLSLSLLASRAESEIGTVSGEEAGIWEGSSRLIVVVGVVTNVPTGQGAGWFEATFAPSQTIAGAFDPSARSQWRLAVGISAESFGTSSIGVAPRENAIVMIVAKCGADARGELIIVQQEYMDFMPDRRALVELNGLADPRIAETLKRIQRARESRSSPTTAATTTPVR